MTLLLFIGVVVLWVALSAVRNRVRALEERNAARATEIAELHRQLERLTGSWKATLGTDAKPAVRDERAPVAPPAASPTAPTPAQPARPPTPTPAQPTMPPAPAVRAPSVLPIPPVPPAAPPTPRPSPSVTPPPPSAMTRAPAFSFDWEALVGVKLFSWIAGIALALGAIFFLRYSIQSGWLQPPVRMAMGIIAGVGLLVLCEMKAARRYQVTAHALDAAGLVILFSTFFASHALWHLVGALVAFGLLALVAVVAVLLSIRRDSVFIALLGLVGGFSTPALLSTGEDNPFGLFGYLLLLNLGLASVAWRKRWPLLTALSLVFTTLYQWGWVGTFLTPARFSIACGIFLLFGGVGALSAFAARRPGEPGSVDGPGPIEAEDLWHDRGQASPIFQGISVAGASLPMLFAIVVAAQPAYGSQFGLFFGFLFCLAAGLYAVAVWRGPQGLHLFGAFSVVVAFFAWWSANYASAEPVKAWPGILAVVALFVAFYLAAGLAAHRGRWRLGGPDVMAAYAAPALLFMFPALAAREPAFASPALPFATLFVILVAIAAFAIAEENGHIHFVAAFFAVATEAVWSTQFLTEERLLAGLAIYGLFGLLYLAVPLVARRLGRRLHPEGMGGVLLLASIALLFFLSSGALAGAALWGLALLLVILNLSLLVEGRATRHPLLVIAGSALSWLVLAQWWTSGALTSHVVPAMIVVGGLALLVLAGQLWLRTSSDQAGGALTENGTMLALVGHAFLLFVAMQPSLSIPPWPMFGILAVLDLAMGAAALFMRRGELHLVAMVASQVILIVWIGAAPASWPAVGIVSAACVGAFGLAWVMLAGRSGIEPVRRQVFDSAAAASLLLGQLVTLVAGLTTGAPGVTMLVTFHLLFVGAILWLASRTGWHLLAVAAVLAPLIATWSWQASHAAPAFWLQNLALAAPLYIAFLAYPLVLGRRAGKAVEPWLAAVIASGSFFRVARLSLSAGGFASIIGMLPIAQAGLMSILLVALLRLERPGARQLGRLSLVAGTVLAFITVAIPLQLEKEWITIGWALEGAALAWLFTRIPHRGLFWSALGLLAVVFARLALNPDVLVYQPRGELRILNWYLYTYALSAGAMMTAGWWLSTTDDRIVEGLPRASWLLPAAGTIVLFILLNIEIADFYAVGPTIAFNFSAGLAQDLTYTLGWAAFAALLLGTGIVVHSRAARLAAILLLTVTVFKGFLFDVARLSGLYRVGSFVGLAVSLALVAVVLQRFVLGTKPGEPK